MASSPSVPQTPRSEKVQILPADTTTLKTVITGATNGTKVVGLLAGSSDTSNRDLQMWITKGGVSYLLGTKTVPASSGFIAGTPMVNLLDATVIVGIPIDADGQPYVFLETGDTLQVATLVTITAAKIMHLLGIAADF